MDNTIKDFLKKYFKFNKEIESIVKEKEVKISKHIITIHLKSTNSVTLTSSDDNNIYTRAELAFIDFYKWYRIRERIL